MVLKPKRRALEGHTLAISVFSVPRFRLSHIDRFRRWLGYRQL
ncbi:hypothetical protein TVNIR_2091 [Thioalkalivibrio nitratireducens DSM 14787]|uniref:Uncharacterized protein n=1 Tax=Thioalkalivibrio nitratireducens (strain DSM 14787 / UNIQEM 213 / ALEN2) TaxID=1255043 RepID=L0DZD5_THIND|nr:hypothetical protein TVNIR_2091 [Thioalkalivibrio nitratireducens DSM 14787]